MFDKIFKMGLICLLASLVGVAGWFCWTSRDAGRFTFQQTGDGHASVLDSRTGCVYILANGDPKPAWMEMQPQTGHVTIHWTVKPGAK
jgi:hypothetical protein